MSKHSRLVVPSTTSSSAVNRSTSSVAKPAFSNRVGDETIPSTEAVAATAVGQQHHAARAAGNSERADDLRLAGSNVKVATGEGAFE